MVRTKGCVPGVLHIKLHCSTCFWGVNTLDYYLFPVGNPLRPRCAALYSWPGLGLGLVYSSQFVAQKHERLRFQRFADFLKFVARQQCAQILGYDGFGNALFNKINQLFQKHRHRGFSALNDNFPGVRKSFHKKVMDVIQVPSGD